MRYTIKQTIREIIELNNFIKAALFLLIIHLLVLFFKPVSIKLDITHHNMEITQHNIDKADVKVLMTHRKAKDVSIYEE
ncbi:MAG TPA: hypothetical protein VJC03_01960 [bacterium]|nr:hypothetical protein [bacterium]